MGIVSRAGLTTIAQVETNLALVTKYNVHFSKVKFANISSEMRDMILEQIPFQCGDISF